MHTRHTPQRAQAAPAGPTAWSRLWSNWYDWNHRPAAFSADWWLNWLCTGLFCMVIALIFTVLALLVRCRQGCDFALLPWAAVYGRNLVVSATIGGLIHLAYELLGHTWLSAARVQAWAPWQRSLMFSAVPLAGMAIGWPLGMWLAGFDLGRWSTS